jgi:hypothetical protein
LALRLNAALLAALAIFGMACTSPGTDQAVLADRCLTAPLQTAPGEQPTSYEPVWRTYASAGYSLALPADWDGLALGTDHVQADLADAEKRSPQIAAALRRRVTDVSGSAVTFTGLGAPNGAELNVFTQPLGNGATHCISRSLAFFQGWGFINGYHLDGRIVVTRAAFPAGPATILRFSTSSKRERAALADEHILIDAGRQPLELQFWALRDLAGGMEATAWEIAESVRFNSGAAPATVPNPVISCLHPDSRPDLIRVAGRCPVPVGSPLARLDCTGYDVLPAAHVGVFRYDLQTGASLASANLDLTPGSCSASAPPGAGIVIRPAGVMPTDGVVIFDVKLTSGSFGGGLTMRDGPADRVFVSWNSSRQTALSDGIGEGPEQTIRRLGLPGVAGAGDAHRVVLAVSGSSARAWVDGDPLGGPTSIPSHSGDVLAYVSDRDATLSLSLRVLRLYVYPLV